MRRCSQSIFKPTLSVTHLHSISSHQHGFSLLGSTFVHFFSYSFGFSLPMASQIPSNAAVIQCSSNYRLRSSLSITTTLITAIPSVGESACLSLRDNVTQSCEFSDLKEVFAYAAKMEHVPPGDSSENRTTVLERITEECSIVCQMAYGSGNPDLSGPGVREFSAFLTLWSLTSAQLYRRCMHTGSRLSCQRCGVRLSVSFAAVSTWPTGG